MELVALRYIQLKYLAKEDPLLKPYYDGASACDRLPKKLSHKERGYIVKTDEEGKHWISVWTKGNVCEVMDSYGLPVENYGAKPLEEWRLNQWKFVLRHQLNEFTRYQ